MTNVLTVVSYSFLPPKLGGQKCAAFFYKYLSQHCNLVCVTTRSNDTRSVPFKVINTISDSKLRYINPFLFFKFRRIIKEHKITHLLIEHPYYGWLAILLKFFCGVKMIVNSQNIESLRFKSIHKWWWPILWQYEKTTHRMADFSFFITDFDEQYALEHFGLKRELCTIITYGFEVEIPPTETDKKEARAIIQQKHQIDPEDKILLFNGALDYFPNKNALDIILSKINPELKKVGFKYKIIICGKNLLSTYNELVGYKNDNIIYAGFVDDINIYFKAIDIFINPVMDGGGIKTKVVEALGFDVSLVTTASGAIGIPQSITGNKMIVVNDNEWDMFINAVLTIDTKSHIPAAYFKYFYWDNIAKKAIKIIHAM